MTLDDANLPPHPKKKKKEEESLALVLHASDRLLRTYREQTNVLYDFRPPKTTV